MAGTLAATWLAAARAALARPSDFVQSKPGGEGKPTKFPGEPARQRSQRAGGILQPATWQVAQLSQACL